MEFDACQRRQQIDAIRRVAQLNDLIRNQEILRLQVKRSESEVLQRCDDAARVLPIQPEPDVQILGVAWVTVKSNRVATHNQVTHIVIV